MGTNPCAHGDDDAVAFSSQPTGHQPLRARRRPRRVGSCPVRLTPTPARTETTENHRKPGALLPTNPCAHGDNPRSQTEGPKMNHQPLRARRQLLPVAADLVSRYNGL